MLDSLLKSALDSGSEGFITLDLLLLSLLAFFPLCFLGLRHLLGLGEGPKKPIKRLEHLKPVEVEVKRFF